MTSGNRRDEPISKDRAEASANLGRLADLIMFHDREIHNRIRGMGDAFDLLMETVNRLQRYDVNLGFNFTLTPENWQRLADVEEVADHLNIPLLVNYAHTSTHYYGNPNIPLVPENHLDEIDVRLQRIAEKRRRKESLTRQILDPYPYFLAGCTRHQRMKQQLVPCLSGTHSLYLDPQGTVYPCIIRDLPLGNIREMAFPDLWTSPRTREGRRSIAVGDCNCWVACEAVPSILRGLHSVCWNLKMLLRGESQ
jgi:MoaA/NifB/PqqE/SkfB family radical SAM enzyme